MVDPSLWSFKLRRLVILWWKSLKEVYWRLNLALFTFTKDHPSGLFIWFWWVSIEIFANINLIAINLKCISHIQVQPLNRLLFLERWWLGYSLKSNFFIDAITRTANNFMFIYIWFDVKFDLIGLSCNFKAQNWRRFQWLRNYFDRWNNSFFF